LFECPQHGELAPQSAQDIGVDDGVERLWREWLVATAGDDERNSALDALDAGAAARDHEPLHR
jgi:hypothetical protein